jgi:hypothetical protein
MNAAGLVLSEELIELEQKRFMILGEREEALT